MGFSFFVEKTNYKYNVCAIERNFLLHKKDVSGLLDTSFAILTSTGTRTKRRKRI